MGAFAHLAAEHAPWAYIAFVRSILVAGFVAIAAWIGGVRLTMKAPFFLWVRSFSGTISILCMFYALTHLPISNALTITNMYPLWVALLSWPMEGVKPTRSLMGAIAVSFLGVLMIEKPTIEGFSPAVLIALLASISTAIAMLGLNRLKGMDPRRIVVHFSVVSLPFTFLAGLISAGAPVLPSESKAWLLILATGITATGGQYFLTLAFARGDARKTSLISLSQVIFGLTIDMAIWNRKIDQWQVLGIACILLATAWCVRRNTASRLAPPPLETS
jgi:drug/metabolite transporter (DMT)-like permease